MKLMEYPEIAERIYEKRLENGLLVRVIPRPGFAKSFAFMATNFGSIDTDFVLDGKRLRVPDGIAHYLEHKMFDLPEGGAMEQFAAIGGSNNAFTNYTMTAYYVEATEQFEENLKILLRMVTTPYFTEQSVEKERGIIAQEIKMYEDSADSAVFENLFALMFPKHPISVPIAGTVKSIADITPQTLYDCHRAFYDPSNMILCVMGDVDPERIAALAEELTPKSCGKIASRDYGGEAARIGCSGYTEKQMEVSMPSFALGFAADPIEEGENVIRTEIIGDLAAEILIGESSALYQSLYERNVIDSDFSAGFEQVKGVGLLEFSGDSEQIETVRDELLAQAEKIVSEGIDDALFERLKRSMIGRRTRELDSFEGTCYRMSAYFFDGADYMEYISQIRKVQKHDVEQFIRRVVTRDRAALSAILPKNKKEA